MEGSDDYFPGLTEFILTNHYKFTLIYQKLEEIKNKVQEKELISIVTKEQTALKKKYHSYRTTLKQFIDSLKNPDESYENLVVTKSRLWDKLLVDSIGVGSLGLIAGVSVTFVMGFMAYTTTGSLALLAGAILPGLLFAAIAVGWAGLNVLGAYFAFEGQINKDIEKAKQAFKQSS
jgi:hypothetical protein